MTAPTAGATEEAAGGVGNEGDLIGDAANHYASNVRAEAERWCEQSEVPGTKTPVRSHVMGATGALGP